MNDVQAINLLKCGDTAAIKYLIEKYSNLVWKNVSIVLKNIGTAEDIEECVADVFVLIWENSEKFNCERGKLSSWLSSVAKNKAIDKYRILVKSNTLPLDANKYLATLDLSEQIISDETKHILIAAVNSLSEIDREIFMRRFYYGQKPGEIAFSLDIPIKQIENRLYRSKIKLRELLATL